MITLEWVRGVSKSRCNTFGLITIMDQKWILGKVVDLLSHVKSDYLSKMPNAAHILHPVCLYLPFPSPDRNRKSAVPELAYILKFVAEAVVPRNS